MEAKRLEERLIDAMRHAGLPPDEAVQEQVYVEVFCGRADETSDAKELYSRCRILCGTRTEAEIKPVIDGRSGEMR